MQLSPLLFDLIVKSWCLSDREFPKFFKTPLTFNPGLNLKAVIANQTQATSFALVGCIHLTTSQIQDIFWTSGIKC